MAKKKDVNELAALIVGLAIGTVQKAPESARARAGRAGGKKGGKKRMGSLTAQERVELAKKAAAKRWKKPAPGKGAG